MAGFLSTSMGTGGVTSGVVCSTTPLTTGFIASVVSFNSKTLLFTTPLDHLISFWFYNLQ